ncbi:YHS domain-containing (seleno)protein [Algibacter sp.]|uniref:YHS domain-containing (seleno)protein n=1 Tax=Algibacter sp. TaxID=1872428 RepID=UPI003C731674
MKSLILLFTITISSLSAQTIDYNLKKGFVANGYDVVSYFNNEAIEGSDAFTTSFDNVKFKFSSEENLRLFNKNPEKYIPQYGGYCAYAIAIKNDKVSINPKTFQIEDDKLYLFYNAWGTNTLDLWKEKNEDALKAKADKNWKTIKFKK